MLALQNLGKFIVNIKLMKYPNKIHCAVKYFKVTSHKFLLMEENIKYTSQILHIYENFKNSKSIKINIKKTVKKFS